MFVFFVRLRDSFKLYNLGLLDCGSEWTLFLLSAHYIINIWSVFECAHVIAYWYRAKVLKPLYPRAKREFNLIRAAEGKREKYLSMHFERELDDAFRCAAQFDKCPTFDVCCGCSF